MTKWLIKRDAGCDKKGLDEMYEKLHLKSGGVVSKCIVIKKWQFFLRISAVPPAIHCVKSVRFQSYSDPHFSSIFPHSD